MPQMLDTSCVHIRRGDIVLDIERGEPVTVLDMYVAPNGMTDPSLVCIIVARRNDGGKVSQTANRFAALPDEPYEPRYGSDMDRPTMTHPTPNDLITASEKLEQEIA